jgi:hypothetical protein
MARQQHKADRQEQPALQDREEKAQPPKQEEEPAGDDGRPASPPGPPGPIRCGSPVLRRRAPLP